MKILVILFLSASLLQCANESNEVGCTDCSTTAIVKDLTGLDGCGFVFELPDGSRLEPIRRTYVQAPKPEEDPLYHFELKAGDTVRISYKEEPLASVCMVGKLVFVTCIKSCRPSTTE